MDWIARRINSSRVGPKRLNQFSKKMKNRAEDLRRQAGSVLDPKHDQVLKRDFASTQARGRGMEKEFDRDMAIAGAGLALGAGVGGVQLYRGLKKKKHKEKTAVSLDRPNIDRARVDRPRLDRLNIDDVVPNADDTVPRFRPGAGQRMAESWSNSPTPKLQSRVGLRGKLLAGGALGLAGLGIYGALRKKEKEKTAAAEYSTVGRPPKPLKTTTHGEAVRHVQNQIGQYETKIDTKVAMMQDARRDLLKSLRVISSG